MAGFAAVPEPPRSPDSPAAFLARCDYRHDVFVSYSHGDVEGDAASLLKDWSREFVTLLRKFVVGMLKHPVSVFFDESDRRPDAIDPLAPLDEQLARAIAGSALLQVLMSPEYLQSRWCRYEREQWTASQAAKKGSTGNRIAIARVWRTDHESWPAEFKDASGSVLPGFRFHDALDETPWGYGTGALYPNTPGKSFVDEISRLARHIRDRLVQLDAEIVDEEKARAEVAKLKSGEAALYLYAREEHRAHWLATTADLERLRLQVRPGDPEPPDADEDERKRKDLVKIASGCQAMLLVGADGLALDADLQVVGCDRRRFVESRYRRSLPCAVVDRPGTLGTPARRRFADSLQIDWLAGTGAEWPGNVEAWLRQRASARAADGYGVDGA